MHALFNNHISSIYQSSPEVSQIPLEIAQKYRQKLFQTIDVSHMKSASLRNDLFNTNTYL